MDKSWLIELVAQLYISVQGITGYPVPAEMPQVRQLPQAEIQRLVCMGPCQIRAFYHPDHGVVVDESFNLKSSLYHQSILLHELVHHAQHVAGSFDSLESTCQARSASESEAYDVQNRYLAKMQSSERVPVLRWSRLCRDEGGGEPARTNPPRNSFRSTE